MQPCAVAPFAGAWIEIFLSGFCFSNASTVAPFAGAWIEIAIPVRSDIVFRVAPFAGAWIEINTGAMLLSAVLSRTLRGCVD